MNKKQGVHFVKPNYNEKHEIEGYYVLCGDDPKHPKFTNDVIQNVTCLKCRKIYFDERDTR